MSSSRSRNGTMAAKSFAGRARVQASYEAAPSAFARATYSAGTLIALAKSRCTTRTRHASSSENLSARSASASTSRPSAGSTNFSWASRRRVAPWRPRAAAPSLGIDVDWSQESTEAAELRLLISLRRRLSSTSLSSAVGRLLPAGGRRLPTRAVMVLRVLVLPVFVLWDFGLRDLGLRVFAMDHLGINVCL